MKGSDVRPPHCRFNRLRPFNIIKMKKNIYYRNSELKQRGWTDGLIKKFLPKPDETKTNPIVKSAAPMKLYKIKRVKEASLSAISLDYQ